LKNATDDRCAKIIQILMQEKQPITSETIANKLTVSNRTVRNDLEKVESYLSDIEGVRLFRKPRVGIWLEGTPESKHKILSNIRKGNIYVEPFSTLERKRFIIKKLMQSEELLTMQALADELFVSRVTVHKDLDGVEDWLKKYDLKLLRKQNHGIEIVGKEKDWRKAATALLIEIRKTNSKTGDEMEKTYHRLNPDDLSHIKDLIPDMDFMKIEDILIEAEKKMTYPISDEAFVALLIHIAISLERIKSGKDIKMPSKQLSGLKNYSEFDIATWVAGKLEKVLGIKMPVSEIGYITLHLLGAKILGPSEKISDPKEIISTIEPEVVELTKDIILLVQNILDVDFSNDHTLFTGLALHLRTTVRRLEHGLSLRNPLLNEIKEKFPSIFGASWATSILFEKNFGIRITEEEIGYLTIHIGAALERMKSPARAIVVCSSGIGTSQLVVSRLEKRIKNLEIVAVSSVHDVEKYKKEDYDFIISTIPFKYPGKPVIYADVFITDDNIRTINQYIANFKGKAKKIQKEAGSPEKNLFDKDFLFSELNLENKDEIIKYMGIKLIEAGFVDKRFIESALMREKITSTAVGIGVAIPHGETRYVKKSVIACAVLEKPVDWSGCNVDIVFLLALDFETGSQTRKFFKKFYSMLDDEKVLRNLKNAKDTDEMLNYLNLEEFD
jgi:transcriptional antiterminator